MKVITGFFVVSIVIIIAVGAVNARLVSGQASSVCVTGGAIPSGNAGLVADCEALLAMKTSLRGSAKLNWWAGRSIEKWDGIKVQSSRVAELSLPNQSLDGVLPAGLGNLSALKTLDLSSNSLTGQIPASLNNLTLNRLRLSGNSLTGCVPANLLNVADSDVSSLNLPSCGGTTTPATPTPTPPPSGDRVTAIEGRLTDIERRLTALEADVARLMATPTATPTSTATPTPTPTPTPTARPSLSPPPSDLGLDPFYEKYLDADGLPIVASAKVPDEALFQAREIIDEMLVNRPDIRAELIELNRRVTVVSDDEVITDIPEFRDIYEKYPGTDWNTRVQGGGLAGNLEDQTTAIWEGNLLCNENDVFPDEDILVHEFTHTMLNMGVEQQPKGKEFRRRLEAAYRGASDAGLWEQTYAGENSEEYWAEGVQSWFGLNHWAIPTNGVHNQINTRHELEAYDPAIAELIKEVFGDTTISSTCHAVAASLDFSEDPPIEFLGDVPAAKQAEIRALAADIRNTFVGYTGGEPAAAPLIVSYDQEMLRERFQEVNGYEHTGNICGVQAESLFGSREIRLFVILELPCGRPGVFAHEYAHNYLQATLAPPSSLPDYGPGYSSQGPWWMTEGAAVYGEKLYVVSSGVAHYDDERNRELRQARSSTRALADLETAGKFFDEPGGYSLGFLAVEWLVQHSSVEALVNYYKMLPQHDTWQAAFENAFGIALDEFYDSFEEYRSSLVEDRYRIEGVVLGPTGEPLEGIGIWAWQGKSENSGSGETEPDGTFYIVVPEGSFTLDIYTDFKAGCTFVGWYDGAGGLATERSHAATVVVDDASVEGIEIRLPDYPYRLPFIEWCS